MHGLVALDHAVDQAVLRGLLGGEEPVALGVDVDLFLALAGVLGEVHALKIETMTRRQVLRHLGVMSGKGSADSRVRAACIADHETPGGPPAVGRKASPGPLYGVSSHAWQALGLVLAWLEIYEEEGEE